METGSPSIAKILTMVLFALSVIGLTIFLWVSFGGTLPLTPRGYEFRVSFTNASQLADYVDRCVTESAAVVVDLSALEFFGTAGFSALHLINVRCAGANQRWALVPSNAVSRLLRICDPDNTLPLVDSVSAFHDGEGEGPDPNRLFQLVT